MLRHTSFFVRTPSNEPDLTQLIAHTAVEIHELCNAYFRVDRRGRLVQTDDGLLEVQGLSPIAFELLRNLLRKAGFDIVRERDSSHDDVALVG